MNPKDAIGKSKSLLHLVPPALMIWAAEVFRFSAPKYGPFNWRNQRVNRTVYLDATMRHLLAMIDGQRYDVESGLPHEAHIAANMAILLDAQGVGQEYNDMNYADGNSPQLLISLTKEVKSEPGPIESAGFSFTVPANTDGAADRTSHRGVNLNQRVDGSDQGGGTYDIQ